MNVLSWLLNHNAALRPTSSQLLQSSYLPPPQLEEAELQEMVRHTLSNTQSKAYKHLVASCFRQTLTASDDIVYDMDTTVSPAIYATACVLQTLHEVFSKHCQRRGAVPLKVAIFYIYIFF